MLLLSLMLGSPVAMAAQCDTPTGSEVAGDIGEVLDGKTWEVDESTACDPFVLPAGEIGREQLTSALDAVRASNPSICDLFSALGDGQERSLSGGDLAWFMRENGLDLGLLPLDELTSVVASGSTITLNFDFENERDTTKVKIPKGRVPVFNIDTGSIDYEKVGGHTLVVSDEVVLNISDSGVSSVREGDIKVPWGFFTFDLSLATECEDAPSPALENGNPVVATDENGEPISGDNGWEIEYYDSWAVISAGGQSSRMGVPRLGGSGEE